MDKFTKDYMEAALWSSMNDDEYLDQDYGFEDFSPESLEKIEEDCKKFQEKYSNLLAKAGDDEQNGHDFWLTRNDHGAGFWDRGYDQDVSDGLTNACDWQGEFGECNLYVGADDLIYFI